ncbi:hypothetical protein STAS_06015 [Striga asiatica]|uniref:Uncharacterized protein n=1 Tax=Striga asiatica TaxID=4170 RepID=A0A5A7PC45_STRAF|nr:hypothetical protein STAS_06015 [Striga asiatica]
MEKVALEIETDLIMDQPGTVDLPNKLSLDDLMHSASPQENDSIPNDKQDHQAPPFDNTIMDSQASPNIKTTANTIIQLPSEQRALKQKGWRRIPNQEERLIIKSNRISRWTRSQTQYGRRRRSSSSITSSSQSDPESEPSASQPSPSPRPRPTPPPHLPPRPTRTPAVPARPPRNSSSKSPPSSPPASRRCAASSTPPVLRLNICGTETPPVLSLSSPSRLGYTSTLISTKFKFLWRRKDRTAPLSLQLDREKKLTLPLISSLGAFTTLRPTRSNSFTTTSSSCLFREDRRFVIAAEKLLLFWRRNFPIAAAGASIVSGEDRDRWIIIPGGGSGLGSCDDFDW